RGGQDRRVGGAEELDDSLARLRPEEAHALVEPELVDPRLERRSVGSFAGDHELHAVRGRDRLECPAERLLRRQPSGECDRRAVQSEALLNSSRAGRSGRAGAGFGRTLTRSGATPHATARSRRYELGQKTCAACRSSTSRAKRNAAAASPPPP